MSEETALVPATPMQRLPWQSDLWRHVTEAANSAHLPHALLLTGIPGVGKRRFALALAQYLLCAQPTAEGACGRCRQCGFLLAGSHPDLKLVVPEEKGRQIRVDQVREVVEFIGHTAQQGGFKVTLIQPAEAMNINAANALLKCLEEPAGQSLLVLIADAPGRLPATIRSRCQQLRFATPAADIGKSWLEQQLEDPGLARQLMLENPGQPLLALERAGSVGQFEQWDGEFLAALRGEQDLLALAEQWQQWELAEILGWLAQRVTALIGATLAGAAPPASWQELAGQVDAAALYLLLDEILLLNQQLSSGANPNRQLALENLLLLSCDKFHSHKGLSQWRTAG